jgi:hypothetical protein
MAERITKRIADKIQDEFLKSSSYRMIFEAILSEVKEAEAAAYDRCIAELERLRNEKRKCSKLNAQHDDQWCFECEAMEDAYGVAEQALEALRKRG